MSWPQFSAPAVFGDRRRRLLKKLTFPALFAAGVSRPKNYPHNRFAFRADSHFLYYVGKHLENALLLLNAGEATLYVNPPDPEEEIWSGRMPRLAELAQELGLEVKPLAELSSAQVRDCAVLPPQDGEAAEILSELVGRFIEPGGGAHVEGVDQQLADAVIEQRLYHDAAAIEQLRSAAQVTASAHRAGMLGTHAGLREAHVRSRMEAAIGEQGCSTAYNSIVTVHGEILHAVRYDGQLEAGDLLLADVGAETPEGWAGDVTRTWPVAPSYSSSQRELYEVVLRAQLAAIAAVKPGQRFLAVHRAAGQELLRGLLELGIFRGDWADLYSRGAAALFFPHAIGHLLGLDVHDMEDLGDRAGYAAGRTRSTAPGDRYLRLDRDLAAGMVVTIEPGFYQIPQILQNVRGEVGDLESALDRQCLARYADVRGIRIEDDVLVTQTGCEVLTAAIPKTSTDVEALRRAAS